jgi:death-on-curing protein
VGQLTEPVWIVESDVRTLHDHLLAVFGGAAGSRDDTLLKSAVARPKRHYAYGGPPDIVALAAVYTAGIVRNHPFVDGNKRTGFIAGALFLELNGYRLTASEEDATQAMMELAAGRLDKLGYGAFLRANATHDRK